MQGLMIYKMEAKIRMVQIDRFVFYVPERTCMDGDNDASDGDSLKPMISVLENTKASGTLNIVHNIQGNRMGG